MGFRSQKELKSIRAKLAKVEPARMLPKNASQADRIKYKICKKFVIYLMENEMSQVQLAKKMKIDPSRINEIVKYRIDLYTVDKLLDLAEKLHLDLHVEVA
jgi:predicted XRE-type DNA-binding protein